MDLFTTISFHLDELFYLLLAALMGLAIRFSLQIIGQNWVATFHHTASYFFLPVIGFVITKLISNSIALSLGMIGALSIIRFRNPVKNPLELVIFFALLTIGIGMSSEQRIWGLGLSFFIIFGIFFLNFLEIVLKKLKVNFTSLSFQEGTQKNLLEFVSTKKLIFENNNNLQSIIEDPDKAEYIYVFAFDKKEDALLLKSQFENNKDIKRIDLRFLI
jgi:hypothetical protein|tara:strand:+ start:33 stop:683 length:651 start_codon:yes stop_codon:yes gene_type:complete